MVKNSSANAGDVGSIPGSGRSPGKGNVNPLQHSCLENIMDRGAWWATVQGLTKSQTQLSTHSKERINALEVSSVSHLKWREHMISSSGEGKSGAALSSIYLRVYNSAIKRNKLLTHTTTWMTLKNIVWRESSQTWENTLCMVTFIITARTSKKSIVIRIRNT